MKIGYARVSTETQSLDLQIDALKNEGCERIYSDVCSSVKIKRPDLEKALDQLRKGDVLVIWRLDRLGRSIKELIELSSVIDSRGAELVSLNESIDTSSIGGRLLFHIFASLAEFERNLIIDRTNAGLEAARSRGRVGGRPVKLSEAKRNEAVSLYHSKKLPIQSICDLYGISRACLYRYVSSNDK